MTAATSAKSETKSKSFFGTRYKNRIAESSKLLIINIVMAVLGLPNLTAMLLKGFYLEQKYHELNTEAARAAYQDYEPIAMIVVAVIAISISILSGIVAVHGNYDYLYKKSIADMNYSLPLNTKQRYFADYLAGFTVYFVPALCSVIVSLIMYFVGGIFIDMSTVNEVLKPILMAISIILIAMILFYSLCTFSVTWAGSTFEAIFSSIAINALIPAVMACLWFAIISTSGFGLDGESILYNNFFNCSNPIGAAIFLVYFLDEGFYSDMDSFVNSLYARWIITTLVFSVLFTIGGYLLYKHRKAEDVSKPYVYKSFYYLMMSGAVFCILSLFITLSIENVIAGIIMCAIMWFIMEVITRRGFKRFWTAGIGFAVTVGAVFGICGICSVTDGFGTPKHVPSAISVSRVGINSDEILDYRTINFKDKDVIKAATELQSEIIDRHYNPKNYTYKVLNTNGSYQSNYVNDSHTIEITYYTITGTTIKRQYDLTSGITENLVKAIMLSDDYADYLSKQLMNNKEYNSKGLSTGRYNINIFSKLKIRDSAIVLSEKEIKDLMRAYKTDMQNMTEDDLMNGNIIGYINNDFMVLDTFSNTIEFFNSMDISFPEITLDYMESQSLEIGFNTDPVYTAYETRLYGEDYNYRNLRKEHYSRDSSLSAVDKIVRLSGSYSPSGNTYFSNYNSSLVELLNQATSTVIGEMPLAELYVNGNTFYILDRGNNAKLLKKVPVTLDVKYVKDTQDDYYYYD